MIQAINVPEIGENVESGVVVAVHIKAGDTLAVDDTVIELETDKALVEIPSPFAGRVTEVLAEPGAQMNVGDVIARVETEGLAAEADRKMPRRRIRRIKAPHPCPNAAQKKRPLHQRHQQPRPRTAADHTRNDTGSSSRTGGAIHPQTGQRTWGGHSRCQRNRPWQPDY
jgi:pyruvate/2-oxoglutarate dehydrogenase complex dihydrolipoamide acyltransferase (E2) component